MTTKSFNSIVGAIAVSACMISTPAQAQIPTTDFEGWRQKIISAVQRLQAWSEERELMRKSMDQAGMNAGLQVDNLNNAVSNMIVRQGRSQQEIQNLAILQDSLPAQDACQAYSAAVNLDDALCAMEDAAQQAGRDRVENLNTLGMTGPEFDEHSAVSVYDLVTRCRQLSLTGELDDTECLNTQLLLGGAIPTMSDQEAAATETQISLLVNPIPERLIDERTGSGPAQDVARALAVRKLSLQGIAANALTRVRAERLSVNGEPSRLQLLRDFAEERFGSAAGAEYLALMTNTHPDKQVDASHQTQPGQVLRSMAVMDGFRVYMQAQQYEQQLRMNALHSAILSAVIDPPSENDQ